MINMRFVMKLNRLFLDLDRFLCSRRNESSHGNTIFVDYEDRKRYEEQMMYFQMGINIAAMSTSRMPFFLMKSGPFQFIRKNDLGDKILFMLNHASQSRVLEWDQEYKEVISLSPILRMTYESFYAASSAGGEVDGVGYVKPVLYLKKDVDKRVINGNCETITLLNDFVLNLRKSLRSNKIKEETKSFKRNADERYYQLMKVAMQAWRTNSKHLLLRVDWGFHKTEAFNKPRFKTQEKIIGEFELVDIKRKMMIKRLQKMYGAALSFYSWKIECGLDRGLHMHWLIAINGHIYQNAWFHSKRIAEDWNENVCEDESCCWNPSVNKDFKKIYLRNIDYRDSDLPNILDTFIGYLTKVDITMKLRAPSGYRSFGCTKLKKEKIKKTGPKRKNEF